MSVSEHVGLHLRQHVLGYVAVFLALAGTSYAAVQATSGKIAKNSVKSKHIKDGQVKSGDVADDGLTGADINEATLNVLLADGSVTTAKLADSAVTIPKLAFDPATQAELDAVATGAVPANDSLGAAEPPAADDQIADGSIDTEDLTNDSIVNADVSGSAAIADSKLGTIDDAGKVADSALSSDIAQLSAAQTFTGAIVMNHVDPSEGLTLFNSRTGSDTTTPFAVSLTNQSSGSPHAARIINDGGSTSTVQSLLNLSNNDALQANAALAITAASGGFEDAIAAADSDIDTALNIGANDIKTDTATISAAELEELDGNPTRSVNLPITGFVNSTDAASINFGVSDGTAPDLALIEGAPVIEYDDTATGAADGDTIATSFAVPIDYASGNTFFIRASKDGSTGAVGERLRCATSINGAAVGGTTSVIGFSQAISTLPFNAPGTYTPGASVGLECNVDDSLGGTTQDDVVRIHSVAFVYSADS